MKVNVCSHPTSAEVGGSGAVGRAVEGFAAVDRAMAQILRAIAEAGPVDGLPAARMISLAAGTTGWDVRYLRRLTDTLTAMPGVWTAFDQGRLSWSQMRGISGAAAGLCGADRNTLDQQLSGAIAQNATAEPDRIVEVAGDLAARLDDAAQERREDRAITDNFLRFQPNLFGGARLYGELDDQAGAAVIDAIVDAADAPVAEDHKPVDAEGTPVPKAVRPPTSRSGQLAEGLLRISRAWHHRQGQGQDDQSDRDGDNGADGETGMSSGPSGDGGGGRPTTMVVVDIADLTPAEGAEGAERTGSATARLLWRLAGGRRQLSRARVHALSCDSLHVPVLTDGNVVLAVGDAHDPIPLAVRRAAVVRDQGCRGPGCDRPVQDTDLHHVVFREHGGPTELGNLVSLCRRCHNLAHKHGWQMTLYDDGRLVMRKGRWRFVSHPRLRPPPPTGGPPGDRSGGPPKHADSANERSVSEPRDHSLPF